MFSLETPVRSGGMSRPFTGAYGASLPEKNYQVMADVDKERAQLKRFLLVYFG